MPPSANRPALRSLAIPGSFAIPGSLGFPERFGFLFNAWSCQALGHFIVVLTKADIVFP
jgi:hypothetical protein